MAGIASAYDKESASGDYGTLVLRWNASDKPDDEAQEHEDDRRDDYASTPNEKNVVVLSPLQRLNSAVPDRLKQCFEIALVLVCIGQRKFGDGFVKART